MSHLISLLLLVSLSGCGQSSKLDSLLSDLSTGAPEYQSIQKFSQPVDAVKGNYFDLEFTQSASQFHRFVSSLGTTEPATLSPTAAPFVRVASKINPRYPWFLTVKAEAGDGAQKTYHVHVEGRQPYN
jgi:hypothetical protein